MIFAARSESAVMSNSMPVPVAPPASSARRYFHQTPAHWLDWIEWAPPVPQSERQRLAPGDHTQAAVAAQAGAQQTAQAASLAMRRASAAMENIRKPCRRQRGRQLLPLRHPRQLPNGLAPGGLIVAPGTGQGD